MADAGEYLRRFVHVADRTPDVCEDCGQWSDLGFKCRACYAAWSRALYADIPEALRVLHACVHDLHELPVETRYAVACQYGPTPAPVALSGRGAQVRLLCTQVMRGPFSANLEAVLSEVRRKGPNGGETKRSLRSALAELE